MTWLVLLHVLSALISSGPTYFSGVLLRSGQDLGTLRHNLALSKTPRNFPKIGGTVAVLSGLALVWLGHYGPVTQLWPLGSLALYVLIQVVVVGYAAPRTGQLANWAYSPVGAGTLPPAQTALLRQIGVAHLLVGLLGVALFVLMIRGPSWPRAAIAAAGEGSARGRRSGTVEGGRGGPEAAALSLSGSEKTVRGPFVCWGRC